MRPSPLSALFEGDQFALATGSKNGVPHQTVGRKYIDTQAIGERSRFHRRAPSRTPISLCFLVPAHADFDRNPHYLVKGSEDRIQAWHPQACLDSRGIIFLPLDF